MSRMLMVFASLGIVVAALSLGGCGGKTGEQGKKTDGEKTGAAKTGGHSGEHGGMGTSDPKVKAALAELSAEDRAAAEKQGTCPVSGQPLGSMGKPYKVTVNDREVFLCCQGCEETIKSDPDKYLAELDK